MSSLYDEFEKRFTNSHFSAGWIELEVKPQSKEVFHKDLDTLQAELIAIEEKIEDISQKQLRLSNLAKMYNN